MFHLNDLDVGKHLLDVKEIFFHLVALNVLGVVLARLGLLPIGILRKFSQFFYYLLQQYNLIL
jgi:hypothetical protein